MWCIPARGLRSDARSGSCFENAPRDQDIDIALGEQSTCGCNPSKLLEGILGLSTMEGVIGRGIQVGETHKWAVPRKAEGPSSR